MLNFKSEYDKRDSVEIGSNSQLLFEQIAASKGFGITRATSLQDMKEHWDLEIIKNNVTLKVDVKGLKRLNRWSDNFQEDWLWIELRGNGYNNKGWLYTDTPVVISFETFDSFVFITKQKIKQIVNDFVKPEMVNKSFDAKYKHYNRYGREDLLTLIETRLVTESNCGIWKKE